MQAARRSPRSVAVDEIQQEVGLPPVTAGLRAIIGAPITSSGSCFMGAPQHDGQDDLHIYTGGPYRDCSTCRDEVHRRVRP